MGYLNQDPGFSAADPLEASEIHEILESAGRQSEEANNRLIRLFENYLQLFRRQTWLDPQQVAGSREMWALLKRSSLQSYETQRRLHELMDDYQRFMARETRPRSTEIPPPAPPRAPSPAITPTPPVASTPPPQVTPAPPSPPRAPSPAITSTPPVASAPPPPSAPEPQTPQPAPAPVATSAPVAQPAPAPVQPTAPPVPGSPSSLADAAEESALILSAYSGDSSGSPHGSGNQNLGAREFIVEELSAAGSTGVSMRTLNKRFMNYFSMRSANPVSLWATNISRMTKSGEICTEEKVDGRWYLLSANVQS